MTHATAAVAKMTVAAPAIMRRSRAATSVNVPRRIPFSQIAAAFVAPDGTGIVGIQNSSKTSLDIFRFQLTRPTSRPVPASPSSPSTVEPLIQTTFSETNAEISPDGRYLAYQSTESGRGTEIYVRPFPRVNDGRWQASTRGGTRPVWARNGRELFYLDLANTLTAVPVQTSGATFAVANPTKVFDTAYAVHLNNSRTYDVSPDGQRFLMIKEDASENRNQTRVSVVVVLNWQEELKQRVPVK